MKNKQQMNNFNNFFTHQHIQRQNDMRASNVSVHNPLKLNKNLTCTEDEKLMEDPAFILLCIKDLQNELKQKQEEYQTSILSLQQKIYDKEIQGKNLNDELRSLRREMGGMKEEVITLSSNIIKSRDSPYELHQPKRRLKKNRSSQFLFFKAQSRSKSKKENRR